MPGETFCKKFPPAPPFKNSDIAALAPPEARADTNVRSVR